MVQEGREQRGSEECREQGGERVASAWHRCTWQTEVAECDSSKVLEATRMGTLELGERAVVVAVVALKDVLDGGPRLQRRRVKRPAQVLVAADAAVTVVVKHLEPRRDLADERADQGPSDGSRSSGREGRWLWFAV